MCRISLQENVFMLASSYPYKNKHKQYIYGTTTVSMHNDISIDKVEHLIDIDKSHVHTIELVPNPFKKKLYQHLILKA